MQIPLSLSLRQIEVFLRVAELRSFSEASKVLYVSQPALTRNIQQTELALGARLFDRDTRNVELTAVGLQLLPIARRVLGEFKIACTEMTHFVEGLQGKLNVAAMPSVAAAVLPPIIARFCQSHPKVDFRITELQSPFIPDAVANGMCDFGVSVPPPKDRRASYKHLFSDDIFLVCKADDPIATRKSVPWTVFTTRPWIAMVRGCSIRAIAEPIFLKLNIEIKPRYECQHLSTVRSLLDEGLGISAVSSLIFRQINHDGIVARRLIQPTASRSVGIVTRPGRSLPPAAREFLKALVEAVSDTSPGNTSHYGEVI
jgi:LysR family carnitine catabolism transcriptional activator